MTVFGPKIRSLLDCVTLRAAQALPVSVMQFTTVTSDFEQGRRKMKRIIGWLLIMLTLALSLPIEAASTNAPQDWRRGEQMSRRDRDRWQRQRRNRGYYGYRNYGQFRRTQVGNRRFRWGSRPYWSNGRR